MSKPSASAADVKYQTLAAAGVSRIDEWLDHVSAVFTQTPRGTSCDWLFLGLD
jgi:hypothetical protein